MKEGGFQYVLETLPVSWQYFVTLTLRPGTENVRIANRMFFEWVRRAARTWKVAFDSVVWVRRAELGEQTRRLHFHALLTCQAQPATKGECFRLMALWEQTGGGLSRVRLFERDRDFAQYLLKVPSAADTTGANRYERSKFSLDTSEVILCSSLVRMIRRRSKSGD